MLRPELLLFSRTASTDYRWIYFSDSITTDEKKILAADYRMFDYAKADYLGEKHLFVRSLSNSIVVYRFYKSAHKDDYFRPIFGLVGFVFSGFDRWILASLMPIVAASLYLNQDSLFECDSWKATDDSVKQRRQTVISIDTIVEECRNSAEGYSLMQRIYSACLDGQSDDFAIKQGKVEILPAQQKKTDDSDEKKESCWKNKPKTQDDSLNQTAPKRQGSFRDWWESRKKNKEPTIDEDGIV